MNISIHIFSILSSGQLWLAWNSFNYYISLNIFSGHFILSIHLNTVLDWSAYYWSSFDICVFATCYTDQIIHGDHWHLSWHHLFEIYVYIYGLIFGCSIVNVCTVFRDLNPLHDVTSQQDYKRKYYNHLIPLGHKYAEVSRIFSTLIKWSSSYHLKWLDNLTQISCSFFHGEGRLLPNLWNFSHQL